MVSIPFLTNLFKSFYMANYIAKLQFATMVDYQAFFWDANPNPGKESVKKENIHVYLAPLIEELQRLWKKVKAIDGSLLEKAHKCVEDNDNTNPNFKLQAILMWAFMTFWLMDCLLGKSQKGTEIVPHVGHMCQRGGPSLWEKMLSWLSSLFDSTPSLQMIEN